MHPGGRTQRAQAWPSGHILGWKHTFVHQLHHLVKAIVGQGAVGPIGADFHDGYVNTFLCDALLQAAKTGRVVRLKPANR